MFPARDVVLSDVSLQDRCKLQPGKFTRCQAVRGIRQFADAIRARLVEIALGDVRGVEVDHRPSRSSDWYTTESVLFDLDDTILDDSGCVELSWTDACEECCADLARDQRARIREAIHHVADWVLERSQSSSHGTVGHESRTPSYRSDGAGANRARNARNA